MKCKDRSCGPEPEPTEVCIGMSLPDFAGEITKLTRAYIKMQPASLECV